MFETPPASHSAALYADKVSRSSVLGPAHGSQCCQGSSHVQPVLTENAAFLSCACVGFRLQRLGLVSSHACLVHDTVRTTTISYGGPWSCMVRHRNAAWRHRLEPRILAIVASGFIWQIIHVSSMFPVQKPQQQPESADAHRQKDTICTFQTLCNPDACKSALPHSSTYILACTSSRCCVLASWWGCTTSTWSLWEHPGLLCS
jgi:hypothetical protein